MKNPDWHFGLSREYVLISDTSGNPAGNCSKCDDGIRTCAWGDDGVMMVIGNSAIFRSCWDAGRRFRR